VRRRRHELASAGFDDFFALLGGMHNTGLRFPQASIGALSGAPLDFPFLLDAADLLPGDALVGLGQYLSIANPQVISQGPVPGPAAPVYPVEVPVRTPLWRFNDTFLRWIVTMEGTPGPVPVGTGPSDSDSFAFEDSQGSCLVYETVHFPAVPTAPGYLGLDDYTSPGTRGTVVLEARDLRYPWNDENTFESLFYPVQEDTRVRFYLHARQSDPGSRQRIPLDPALFAEFPDSFAPEDGFVVAGETNAHGLANNSRYWRCAGRLLIDRGREPRSDTAR